MKASAVLNDKDVWAAGPIKFINLHSFLFENEKWNEKIDWIWRAAARPLFKNLWFLMKGGGWASHSLSAIQIKIIFIWAAERKNERSEARFRNWWMLVLVCLWLVGYGRSSANGSAKRREPNQKPTMKSMKEESNESKWVDEMEWKQLVEWMNKFICSWMKLMRQWNGINERGPKELMLRGKWNQSILLLLARPAPSKRRVEWLKGAVFIPSLILIWFHSHSIKINQ